MSFDDSESIVLKPKIDPRAARLFDGSPWHLWVMEYGITHRRMRLSLHRDHFLERTELMCGDVTYFRGEVGGPARVIRLIEEPEVAVLRDDAGELELRLMRLALHAERRFELGRLALTLDADGAVATILDMLDAPAEGAQRLSMSELAEALTRHAADRSSALKARLMPTLLERFLKEECDPGRARRCSPGSPSASRTRLRSGILDGSDPGQRLPLAKLADALTRFQSIKG
jgi:hypothetical protein